MSITTKATRKIRRKFRARGFTLTELTIVLVIVALLIGGLMVPLSAQREVQNINETKRQLAEIREALLGFAAANGRLPCPAVVPSTAGGVESPENPTVGDGCENWDGYLPAVTLGIGPTDRQGYAIDAWSNRIRYAVTKNKDDNYSFTKPGEINRLWSLNLNSLAPDLLVCSEINSSGNGCQSSDGQSTGELTRSAVAVIISTGPNGATSPTSVGEQVNRNPNQNTHVFVNAEPSDAFDDIVTWISPNILYSRLISAGKLP